MPQTYEKIDFSNAVVDSKTMRVDPSTPLGQQIQVMHDHIAKCKDPNEKAMLEKFMFYTEASIAINTLYPNEEGKRKMDALMKKMYSDK